MFNVLPQEEKIALAKEYKFRRLIVLALLFVISFAIGLVLLFPSYLISSMNHRDTVKALEEVEAQLNTGTTKVITPEETRKLKDQISVINASKNSNSVFALYSLILESKTASISILNLKYQLGPASDVPTTILVTGRATTRDSLTQFQRNLEAKTEFSSVDLPISNLAKESNISFTLTINVREKK